MVFWKVRFDDNLDGFGWLQFNESMVAVGLFDLGGNLITEACGYHPVEFDTMPEWYAPEEEITIEGDA